MSPNNDGPVAINEASRILGVSEAALRQWTDEGRIKSFVTPGGHRRYSKAELKKFMEHYQKTPDVKDLAIELEDTLSIHREIDISFLQSIAWYSKLDAQSQKRLAALGRSLLSSMIKGISQSSKQEETMIAARDIGRQFGLLTCGLKLPLIDSIHGFIQHREPIVKMVSEFMKKSGTFNRRVAEAIPLVDHAMDEALIFLVAAHQENKSLNGTKEKHKGE